MTESITLTVEQQEKIYDEIEKLKLRYQGYEQAIADIYDTDGRLNISGMLNFFHQELLKILQGETNEETNTSDNAADQPSS